MPKIDISSLKIFLSKKRPIPVSKSFTCFSTLILKGLGSGLSLVAKEVCYQKIVPISHEAHRIQWYFEAVS
jgi:hypothetical protein